MKFDIEKPASSPQTELPYVRLLGLDLNAVTERQAVDHVMELIHAGRGGWVITPNLDHLRRSTIDPEFAAFFKQAELVVCDGMPLVWASNLQGTPLPARVAGSDLIWSLTEAAARHEVPIYLLGGDPGAAEAAGRVFCERYPGLKIVGVECPPYGFDKDDAAVAAIVERLKAAQPGVVYVGLGSPKQEQLIARIRGCLPQAWFIGVGISFSFVSGQVKRAPKWMRRMEWLHRLLQEPQRLARRYLIDDLPFLRKVILSAFARRVKGDAVSYCPLAYMSIGPGNAQALEILAGRVAKASREREPAWPAPRTYPGAHIKSRLAAMILLGGRLRSTALGRRAGRSRLDLPIDQDRSLLAFWRDEAVGLAHAWDARHLPLRVLLDQASPMPTLPSASPGVTITVERDEYEFRGTGGLLRDACADYDDDDWILVANAAQLLFGSLQGVADRMAEAGGEINVVHDSAGIPNGLILLRCGVLRSISDIGFHDMKEQVIPTLAKRHTVKVVSTVGLTSRPIHSLKDFTEALRSYHTWRSNGPMGVAAADERWQSHFSICEPGAVVAPTAIIHDAVILHGAVVEKGAVVVRSVVGQGAHIRSGQRVIDEIFI
jgi:N-acetylglucosaminyldiphosphoundecaprenol N-acetyl-beta-D-mannosaminyltransferase